MNSRLRTNSIASALLAMNAADALPVAIGSPTPGIFAMNEGEFASAFYDQQLTNYLVGGWDQDDIESLLNHFAPSVRVERSFEYKEYNHKDEFYVDDGDEDIRAMNADFATAQNRLMVNTKNTVPNKGYKIVLDKDRIKARPGYEREEIRRIARRLKRNELRRAIALADAAAILVNLVWDNSSDPDQDISDQLLTSEESVGLRPNRVAYGSRAWSYRQSGFRGAVGDRPGANASADWTPDRLAQFLMVDVLSFGEVRYRQTATQLANFIGDSVYMFNASEGLSTEDPSNFKRFVSTTEGGLDYAVHVDDSHPKLIVYYVEHYSQIALTSPLGIRKATVSQS